MNVDAAAAAVAADELVHFLFTFTIDTSLRSCRLKIPKNYLENLPNSYLAALSSERWAGDDANCSSGTTASPFTVSIDDCPEGIVEIWSKHCRRAKTPLIPLIEQAYASAVAEASTPIVLPYNVEMEDGVNFLKYYGILPPGDNAMDMIKVPSDGPAAVYLRSKLYPVEAKRIKTIRNYMVSCIANNPERITYFVFEECSSNKNFIQEKNAVPGGRVISLGKKMGDGTFIYDIVANSKFRDKLVHHLTEEDKLEAEFVTEPFLLTKLGEKTAPDGRRDQQTLVAINEEDPDDLGQETQYWQDEDYEIWDEGDHRILRWRHVLKVQIPDV